MEKVCKSCPLRLYNTKHHNLQGYAECSAKTNENILETFRLFYTSIYKKNKTKLVEKTKKRIETMQAKIEKKNQESFCC